MLGSIRTICSHSSCWVTWKTSHLLAQHSCAGFTTASQTYSGKDQIRQFFIKAAPFQPENHWVSDTPAYKIRMTVNGGKGTLYFECHYVDSKTGKLGPVTAADQQVARIDGRWLITDMVGASATLSP